MANQNISVHGFTAVKRDFSALLPLEKAKSDPPKPMKIEDFEIPTSELSSQVQKYASENLPKPTYHHSMRVYYYGLAILPYLSKEFSFSHETYFLSCLLHDIGTVPSNLNSTYLSFEFHGGFISHSLLQSHSSPQPQVEAVVEAIIRHQDIGSSGMITALGALLQLATVYDNLGKNPEFVHEDTIKNVVAKWPRLGWSKCFAETIEMEGSVKPWAHTTALGIQDFRDGVLGNKLMEPFE